MKHRIFIAINLPLEIKKKLDFLIQKLKEKNQHSKIKWVEKNNIHITLHFLGWLEKEWVKKVDKVLNGCIKKMTPTEFELTNLDGFPDLNFPRIIFMDSKESNTRKMLALQKKIGQELEKSGFEIDQRSWRSHITLGRNKGNKKFNPVKSDLAGLKFKVNSIEMMESALDRTGPTYHIVKSYKF